MRCVFLGAIIVVALLAATTTEAKSKKKFPLPAFDEETSVPLHNAAQKGLRMPIVGLGTGTYATGGDQWTDSTAQKAVAAFLKLGGRRIDTSPMYKTQKGVGKAIKKSGIPREEIFVTTKIDTSSYGVAPPGYKETIRSVESSLKEMGLEYIDLVLIHFPGTSLIRDAPSSSRTPWCHKKPDDWSACRKQTWEALEDLFERGVVKAIGVSNFAIRHLEEIEELGSLMPAVNQIEYHPFWHLDDVVEWCQDHKIVVNGYSPLGAPDHMSHVKKDMPILLPDHPVVKAIAKEVKRTPAQVLVRYSIDKGLVVNPRTQDKKHMKEILAVMDFELSEDQLDELDEIDDPPYNTNGDMRAID